MTNQTSFDYTGFNRDIPIDVGDTTRINSGRNLDGVVQGMYLKWIEGSPLIFSTSLGKTNGDEKLRSNYISFLEQISNLQDSSTPMNFTFMREILYALNDRTYQGSQLGSYQQLLEDDSVRVYSAKKDMSDVRTLKQVMRLPYIEVKLIKPPVEIDTSELREKNRLARKLGYGVKAPHTETVH